VAAIIILPVVASVGKSVGKANLMIIASVRMSVKRDLISVKRDLSKPHDHRLGANGLRCNGN